MPKEEEQDKSSPLSLLFLSHQALVTGSCVIQRIVSFKGFFLIFIVSWRGHMMCFDHIHHLLNSSLLT